MSSLLRTLGRATELLDDLGVSWAMGGSLSSSLYGEPRSTNDIDLDVLERALAEAGGAVTPP